MRSTDRPIVRSVSFLIFAGPCALALVSLTGCGTTHEPPKMDAATYEQKMKEQEELRAMERGGAPK